MRPLVVGLALFAAVLHATWNAVLRSSADRLWSVTVMSFATTLVALPFAVMFPLPYLASWPYLIGSSVLQVFYSVFLARAYQYGDLGQVYPIIRGSVPPLVTISAFLFTGQHLSPNSLLGVVLVALGIMSLAFGKRRAAPASVLLAFATGMIIASYTTTDAIGVRKAGDARAYAAWIFLIYGVLMPVTFLAIRRRLPLHLHSPEALKAMGGGIVSLLAYGAVISAFALGPMGPISALRETSIIFAALIGRLFLNEALTLSRIAACVVVALGAFCLA